MRKLLVSCTALLLTGAAGFVLGAQSTADHRRIEVSPVAPGAPPRPYTPAVMAGDTLYLSGNIGTDPKTNAPPAAFADAAKQALANQGALLQAAGLSWGDVVKINVYVKDIAKYQEFNAIYLEAIPAPRPARTFIAVADLPGNGQLEIEGIAVKRK
jgi:2-iminobutanoate/2-iminopropanoate deaminase